MQNTMVRSFLALLTQVGTGIGTYLPSFFGGLVTFLVGILVANWTQKIVLGSLRAIKFDILIKDTKIREFLIKAEVTQKLEEIIGLIVKWLIMFTFFIAATNIWGLRTISDMLMGIVGYLPSVVSAVIVIAIGVLLAGIVESMVKAGLASVDLRSARLMGKIASYMVVTIATLAAFSELHIAETFVNTIFTGFIAMLALGFGLAIGLGGKDLVAKMLLGWHETITKELKKK